MGMSKGMVVASVVVVTLGLLTVIFGVAGTASVAQSLVSNDGGVSCDYETSSGVGCGAVAALLALTTQIVASAATGCCGCCRSWGIPSEVRRIVAVILAAFSWIISMIVVILFMVAAIVSTGGDLPANKSGKCVPPGTGAFGAATVLFIISVVFQIVSYMLLEATTVEGSKKASLAQESGIAMGQPAEPLDNADHKAAAGGDPPPLAPVVSSEADVYPPPSASTMSPKATVDPPPSVPTVSPKASDDTTSQV